MDFRNWSIKTKYTVVFALLCFLPLILYAHSVFRLTIDQLNSLEKDYLREQYRIVENFLDKTGKNLLLVTRDYSEWDEGYNKIDSKDLEWFKDNMSGWLPHFAEADIVLLLNKEGEIVDNFNTIDPTLSNFHNHQLFRAAINKESGYQIRQTHLGPAIITYNPVIPTSLQGKPKGVLILGKLVNEKIIREITDYSAAQFFVYDSEGKLIHNNSNYWTQAQVGFQEIKESVLKNGNRVTGNTKEKLGFLVVPLKDYQGEIIGAFQVVLTGDKFMKIMENTFVHSVAILLLSLILAFFLAFLFSQLLSRRITHLSEKAAQAAQGDFSVVIPQEGKDEVGQLAHSFQELLQTINNKIIDLKNTNEELMRLKSVAEELSVTDELTQLYNYRYLKDYLEMEIKKSHRYNHSLSLSMIDIDYFKNYNDSNGHPAGNQVLIKLADLLKASCRETDVIARYGGEEFAIILPETDINNAMLVAESIRKRIQSEFFPLADTQPNGKITVSIGLANFPRDCQVAEELIAKADQALYWAKKHGRNKAILYCPYLD